MTVDTQQLVNMNMADLKELASELGLDVEGVGDSSVILAHILSQVDQ